MHWINGLYVLLLMELGDQWSVNVTYSNQVQGLLSLTAASSRAIKAVVLFPSHHPVTCLRRLVSVLGTEIYSRGQRTDGCTVDMQEVGEGRREDGVGIVGRTNRLVEHHELHACVAMNY